MDSHSSAGASLSSSGEGDDFMGRHWWWVGALVVSVALLLLLMLFLSGCVACQRRRRARERQRHLDLLQVVFDQGACATAVPRLLAESATLGCREVVRTTVLHTEVQISSRRAVAGTGSTTTKSKTKSSAAVSPTERAVPRPSSFAQQRRQQMHAETPTTTTKTTDGACATVAMPVKEAPSPLPSRRGSPIAAVAATNAQNPLSAEALASRSSPREWGCSNGNSSAASAASPWPMGLGRAAFAPPRAQLRPAAATASSASSSAIGGGDQRVLSGQFSTANPRRGGHARSPATTATATTTSSFSLVPALSPSVIAAAGGSILVPPRQRPRHDHAGGAPEPLNAVHSSRSSVVEVISPSEHGSFLDWDMRSDAEGYDSTYAQASAPPLTPSTDGERSSLSYPTTVVGGGVMF